MASSTTTVLPTKVTKTRRGTHVVHVRSFSKLRKEQCEYDGSIASPVLTIGGLDWILRYYPDCDSYCDESAGHVTAFVELVTEDAAAWAHVGISILDQTTGQAKAAIWGPTRIRSCCTRPACRMAAAGGTSSARAATSRAPATCAAMGTSNSRPSVPEASNGRPSSSSRLPRRQPRSPPAAEAALPPPRRTAAPRPVVRPIVAPKLLHVRRMMMKEKPSTNPNS